MVNRKVAIVGVGYTVPRAASPELSYRELTYEAAVRAYDEAGVQPKEIQCFTTCAEDFNEGTSIFDEYVPDQLGAPLKPVHTISSDGLQGLIAAYMQVLTGMFDLAVVEAHSKASNIISHEGIITFATDPIFNRPLNLNPHYLAGLEMNRYLYETGNLLQPSGSEESLQGRLRRQCAMVVVKNRTAALLNPAGVYGAKMTVDDILGAQPISAPLTSLQISQYSDAAIVLVLATEERLKKLKMKSEPIWIKGVGWNSETSWVETKDWEKANYTVLAAKQAYQMAGIKKPVKQIDIFEIDDTYAYKELQHLEALGLCKKGEAGRITEEGVTQREGNIPVNISGGALGMGNMLEASGLFRIVEIMVQLRGEAGRRQVRRPKVGLAHSWRGVPTTTGAVVILSRM